MGNPDELLTPTEAGKVLGVTSTRVRQFDVITLPHLKTSNGWRLYRRRDVEALKTKRAAKAA